MVPLGGRLVTERLVPAGVVLLLDVARDEPSELHGGLVLACPQALALEVPEPPFDDHAVDPC